MFVISDGVMFEISLVLAFVMAFLSTVIIIPWFIEKAKNAGVSGRDENKFDKPEIPEMGGITVVIGVVVGISSLLIFNITTVDEDYSVVLTAPLLAMVGAALGGIMDDLFNLRQRAKAVIPFLFAVPLGFYVEDTTISLIFFSVDFGVFMVLIAPFGVTCAANAGNMLEGFNGLGAGLGIIISIALIILSFIEGVDEPLLLLFPLLGALVAFLYFNHYPAKIFPGDTLTLFMGATIACAVIIVDMKAYGAILFIPMIIEFGLKLKGRFQGENYGKPDKEGYITYEGRIESLTHLIMRRRKIKEKHLVWIIWAFEALLCTILILSVLILKTAGIN